MGKRRNRNRRRKKQEVWTQFRSESIRQTFEDETERERYKEEQKKDLKNIAESKLDLLSRTVVVGSVLPLRDKNNPLRAERNKTALRTFMEVHYGPVQKIGLDGKSKGKFPRGRIIFNFKSDAEKIFDGTSLMEAAGRQVKVPCPTVGYKGSINVRPSPEYKGMMEDDLNSSNSISVNTTTLSLGHWYPRDKDACINLPGLEDVGREKISTWVEENTTSVNPIIVIGELELHSTHAYFILFLTLIS